MFVYAGLAFLIKKAGGYTNTKNHGYLMALSTLKVCFGKIPATCFILLFMHSTSALLSYSIFKLLP
jgi:hypothetical protein